MHPRTRNKLAFLLLLGLILPIYSNTFQASWHLDDYHSIVKNRNIHIENLSVSELKKTLYASTDSGGYKGERLYRPIGMLSFALNWHHGKDQVSGYHAVNIGIHIMTAFFLFLAIQQLLKSPNLSVLHRTNAYSLALLSAMLWAINPIQTQAVTYIVQRMASMAAMFSVLGIYFYCKGRLTDNRLKHKIIFFTSSIASGVLALGCKENAAMLPASLFLIEIVFFQQTASKQQKRSFTTVVAAGLTAAFLLTAFLIGIGKFGSIINGYDIRPFTLGQRLLTEARIVLFYLSEIFYPDATRLSIAHDIELSTSLFNPWTTMPAILVILFLALFAIIKVHKTPLISFAILFFFLNHAIESSIIPLELIFEHRNYLPSMFLFLPIASGLIHLFHHYRKRKSMVTAICLISSCLLSLFAFNTLRRNTICQTEGSMWVDAAQKAPNNSRVLFGLAVLLNKQNKNDQALQLFHMALEAYSPQIPKFTAPPIHRNIALIYINQNKFKLAEEQCFKALEINPHYERAKYLLCAIYLYKHKFTKADEMADILLKEDPSNYKYHTRKGLTSLRTQQYDRAIQSFQNALNIYPNDLDAKIGTGIALSLAGKHGAAEQVLSDALIENRKDIRIHLALIENDIRKDAKRLNNDHLSALFFSFTFAEISEAFQIFSENSASIFLLGKDLEQVLQIYRSNIAQ